MRLLVLGGTEFVGKAVVDEGLSRGWEVTTLNRGSQEPQDGVAALHGDRTRKDGLTALGGGIWDMVVDTWSWAPAAVRDSAALLAGRADHYVYVSSRSVYLQPTPADAAETAPLVDASPDDDTADDYARAKAGGELAAQSAFGDRALLVRAGLILGPHENVGRLPWWLRRIARGGEVLAPGPAEAGIQYIDARDLALWALTAAEGGLGGAYNVVSPPGHVTMQQILEACRTITRSTAELRWTEPHSILAAGIQPWSDLPLWLPPGELYDTLHRGSVSRAIGAGLRVRGVEDTIQDTWTWLQSIGGTAPQRPDRRPVGLDPEVESAVLSAHR